MTNELAIVLAAAIGVAGALGGALIGPFFQQRHERWRADRDDRELLRAKAEELFAAIDDFIAGVSDSTRSAMGQLHKEKVEPQQLPDLGRVRSIALIYFPTSLDLIEAFEADTIEIARDIAEESIAALDAGPAGVDTLKRMPLIITHRYQWRSTKLIVDLRNHLSANVPKLHLEARK